VAKVGLTFCPTPIHNSCSVIKGFFRVHQSGGHMKQSFAQKGNPQFPDLQSLHSTNTSQMASTHATWHTLLKNVVCAE